MMGLILIQANGYAIEDDNEVTCKNQSFLLAYFDRAQWRTMTIEGGEGKETDASEDKSHHAILFS